MADFHFLRPALLGLLLLLLPLFIYVRRTQERQPHWAKILPPHLHKAMLGGDHSKSQSRPWLPYLVMAIMIIALAGPSWDRRQTPLFQLQQGRVLVMDMSASMWATDFTPNRLTHARYKAQDLLAMMDEGELGLVAYAGDAFALAPLSSDRNTIANLLPALNPEIMPVVGSNLPAALQQADKLLQDAGYQQGEIILITDDLLPEHAQNAQKVLQKMPWQLQVLAIGSAEGAPMALPNGEFIRLQDGRLALAKTHYQALADLAQSSGGKMVISQPGDQDLQQLIHTLINPNQVKTEQEQTQALWLDRGGYLLVLVLPLLAFSLRRYGILLILLAPLALVNTPSAHASPWVTDAQQTYQSFEQGAAAYNAEQYEDALEAFNAISGPLGSYNQANALMQLARYQEAIDRYQSVLAQEPNHPQATTNLEIAKALLEQQQQQQQNETGENQQPQSEDGSADEQQKSNPNGQSEPAGEDQDTNQNSPSEPSNDSQNVNQNSPSESTDEDQDANQNRQPESLDDGQDSAEKDQPDPLSSDGNIPTEPSNEASDSNAYEHLTPEQQQRLTNTLNRVIDDPSVLLRNKMRLEYEQRQQQGFQQREQTQW